MAFLIDVYELFDERKQDFLLDRFVVVVYATLILFD